MSGAALFLILVGAMMFAARVFLREERRPPTLPNEDPTAGFRDPARPEDWGRRPD